MGQNSKEAAIYLLDHGADINAVGIDGYSPLSAATEENKLPIVDLLLCRGADPNFASTSLSGAEGQTALHKAVQGEYVDVVERLLAGGANVNKVDKLGLAPLHFAAAKNYLKIVKLLVKNGASIHLLGHRGESPFTLQHYLATSRLLIT